MIKTYKNKMNFSSFEKFMFPDGKQTPSQKISFYVALFVGVFVLFLCAIMPSKRRTSVKFANSKLREVIRSCLQLLEASKQDSNSVIRLAHANYAQAYLNVARMLQNDEEIEESLAMLNARAGVREIEALQADLDDAQKEAMRSAAKQASL